MMVRCRRPRPWNAITQLATPASRFLAAVENASSTTRCRSELTSDATVTVVLRPRAQTTMRGVLLTGSRLAIERDGIGQVCGSAVGAASTRPSVVRALYGDGVFFPLDVGRHHLIDPAPVSSSLHLDSSAGEHPREEPLGLAGEAVV